MPNFSRREFLTAAAGAPAGLAVAASAPRLVSNVFIWTQEFQRLKKKPSESWDEAFASIQRAGYQWVELAADWFPAGEREKTARQLEKYKLGLGEIYTGVNLHDDAAAPKSIARALEAAAWALSLGSRIVLVDLSPKPGRARKSDQELAAEALNLNRLGRAIQNRGMLLALHNHDDPMRENAREWRYVLQHTRPDLLSICLDLDWTWQAGTDPMPLLNEAGSRLRLVHLRTQRQRLWTEALEDGGDIDYTRVAAHLKQLDFDGHLVVELAHRPETRVTRSVEENIRISRLWAERVFHFRA
jgi:inosose dehydratase